VAFALPHPDAAEVVLCKELQARGPSVHKKHNARRYGIPLLERIALSGWGYTDCDASVNFAFWAFSEVRPAERVLLLASEVPDAY
jgi:hypothetical protein